VNCHFMIGLIFLQEVVAVVLSSSMAGTVPPLPSTREVPSLGAGFSAKGGSIKLYLYLIDRLNSTLSELP
jgi:hypothetical protein